MNLPMVILLVTYLTIAVLTWALADSLVGPSASGRKSAWLAALAWPCVLSFLLLVGLVAACDRVSDLVRDLLGAGADR